MQKEIIDLDINLIDEDPLRVDKFSTKSFLSSALHSKRTLSFVVADNPIFS